LHSRGLTQASPQSGTDPVEIRTMSHESETAAQPGRLARRAAILRFLFRYRNSGVFNGLALEPALDQEAAGTEGSPERFADDLEALGPTFVKLGQMLSTRPDLVPPAYAAALERMQ